MEEEKHRAEGLERILPARHRRATERQEQQAIVSFEFFACSVMASVIRRKVERRTDKSSAFFFVVRLKIFGLSGVVSRPFLAR